MQMGKIDTTSSSVLRTIRSNKYSRYKPFKLEQLPEGNLKFVMFWGYLGKQAVDERDRKSVNFLSEFGSELNRLTRRKITFEIMLADSHANINGFDSQGVLSYFEGINLLMNEGGFKTMLLSDLWEKWGLTTEQITQMSRSIVITNSNLASKLEKASRRYFQRDSDDGRLIYYAMRASEKKFIEQEFQEYIFLTYNDPSYREILPDLSTIYFRSRKGYSEPPWIPRDI